MKVEQRGLRVLQYLLLFCLLFYSRAFAAEPYLTCSNNSSLVDVRNLRAYLSDSDNVSLQTSGTINENRTSLQLDTILNGSSLVVPAGFRLNLSCLTVYDASLDKDSWLVPDFIVLEENGSLLLENVIFETTCETIHRYQHNLCTGRPPGAAEVGSNWVLFVSWALDKVNATNVLVKCPSEDASAYSLPICNSFYFRSGVELQKYLVEYQSKYTNLTLTTNQDINISQSDWPSNGVAVYTNVSLMAIKIPDSDTIIDFSLASNIFNVTRHSVLNIVGFVLVNQPIVHLPVEHPRRPFSILSTGFWPISRSYTNLFFRNCTMILSKDEFVFWQYWFSIIVSPVSSVRELASWAQVSYKEVQINESGELDIQILNYKSPYTIMQNVVYALEGSYTTNLKRSIMQITQDATIPPTVVYQVTSIGELFSAVTQSYDSIHLQYGQYIVLANHISLSNVSASSSLTSELDQFSSDTLPAASTWPESEEGDYDRDDINIMSDYDGNGIGSTDGDHGVYDDGNLSRPSFPPTLSAAAAPSASLVAEGDTPEGRAEGMSERHLLDDSTQLATDMTESSFLDSPADTAWVLTPASSTNVVWPTTPFVLASNTVITAWPGVYVVFDAYLYTNLFVISSMVTVRNLIMLNLALGPVATEVGAQLGSALWMYNLSNNESSSTSPSFWTGVGEGLTKPLMLQKVVLVVQKTEVELYLNATVRTGAQVPRFMTEWIASAVVSSYDIHTSKWVAFSSLVTPRYLAQSINITCEEPHSFVILPQDDVHFTDDAAYESVRNNECIELLMVAVALPVAIGAALFTYILLRRRQLMRLAGCGGELPLSKAEEGYPSATSLPFNSPAGFGGGMTYPPCCAPHSQPQPQPLRSAIAGQGAGPGSGTDGAAFFMAAPPAAAYVARGMAPTYAMGPAAPGGRIRMFNPLFVQDSEKSRSNGVDLLPTKREDASRSEAGAAGANAQRYIPASAAAITAANPFPSQPYAAACGIELGSYSRTALGVTPFTGAPQGPREATSLVFDVPPYDKSTTTNKVVDFGVLSGRSGQFGAWMQSRVAELRAHVALLVAKSGKIRCLGDGFSVDNATVSFSAAELCTPAAATNGRAHGSRVSDGGFMETPRELATVAGNGNFFMASKNVISRDVPHGVASSTTCSPCPPDAGAAVDSRGEMNARGDLAIAIVNASADDGSSSDAVSVLSPTAPRKPECGCSVAEPEPSSLVCADAILHQQYHPPRSALEGVGAPGGSDTVGPSGGAVEVLSCDETAVSVSAAVVVVPALVSVASSSNVTTASPCHPASSPEDGKPEDWETNVVSTSVSSPTSQAGRSARQTQRESSRNEADEDGRPHDTSLDGLGDQSPCSTSGRDPCTSRRSGRRPRASAASEKARMRAADGSKNNNDVVDHDGDGSGGGSGRSSCIKSLSSVSEKALSSELSAESSLLTSEGVLDKRLKKLHEDIWDRQLDIQHSLGCGGSAVVYKGVWKGLQVAVKVILIQGGSAVSRQHLEEAAIASSLVHTNIVTTYTCELKSLGELEHPPAAAQAEIGCAEAVAAVLRARAIAGGALQRLRSGNMEIRATSESTSCWKLYIVQEFCDLGTLSNAVDLRWFSSSAKRMQPEVLLVLKAAVDISRGLLHLHNKDIVHGDLTSSNVLLQSSQTATGRYVAKLSDFGLSLKMESGQTHRSRIFHGTPNYVAPEVLSHGRQSKAADVYALGVLLWELFCGTPPWRRAAQAAYDVHRGERRESDSGFAPVQPFDFPPNAPSQYAALTASCLAAEPSARPASAEILRQLESMQEQVASAFGHRL